ncbi:glycosyltransferase family 4 protein [Pleomorphovibrio marinus]|uniref:glycosyltransferase family 4 protein n=1 Tax=Pleomorphovibrio marinus TaxID=2164132 RepID=UPI000E0A2395|nr:glycosyltransferase family 4 protein [Pleomorphovibrio marinus]
MRLIYIHQYFLTPEEGGAVRSFHLAMGMAKAGIRVDVISSHNREDYDIQDMHGFRVHYLPVPYKNEFGFLKRLWSFWNFVRAAKKLILKLPRPDLFFVTSTPLSTGLIGLWAKKRFAIPFVFEVRDLWPEAPVRLGIVKNPLLKKSFYGLEKRIYRSASKIVALSPAIKKHIAKVVPDKEVSLITNFADTDFFFPEYQPKVIDAHDRRSSLKVAYVGAIGFVNGLDQLLNLASVALKENLDWEFVIMGKGAALEGLKAKAEMENLNNVSFREFGDKEMVREVLASADLVYLSFRQEPILGSGSPNKFFDALAMGKPVILNFTGWVKELVLQHHIGFYHFPGKETVLLQELKAFKERPEQWSKMKTKSRKLAVEQFSKNLAIKKLIGLLKPLQRQGKASGAYNRTA